MLYHTKANDRPSSGRQSQEADPVPNSSARRNRKWHIELILTWALLLALLPASPLTPHVALSQDDPVAEDEIVYIDSQGFIQVWDPFFTDKTEVKWTSPVGGYTHFALGDVNNDGDQEIVAIRGTGSGGILEIFDPVLNSSSLTEDGEINGIPWKKLFELPTGFTPTMVATGELDLNVNGDEIAYGFVNGFATGIAVLKGTAVDHDGTNWSTHISTVFQLTWNTMSIGNVNGSSTDEIVLTDTGNGTKDDKSKLHIYRVDTDSLISQTPFYKHSNTNNKWRGTAIGEMKKGEAPEVVAYRSVSGAGSTTIFILQYRPNDANDPGSSMNEADGDALDVLRRPHWAFMADINGEVNGVRDYEAFFIREVREPEETGKSRLFMVNRGDDSLDEGRLDLELDEASNWRRGDGGNVDGDANGRDEVIIMASNKLRLYRYQASGDEHLKLVSELNIGTNENSLEAGDLDAIGSSSGIILSSEISGATQGIPSGGKGIVTVQIQGSSDGVPISIALLDPTNPMIDSYVPGSNLTPSTVNIGIDAKNLLPGTYTLNLQVDSTEPEVTNSPFAVPVSFVVAPATVTLSPAAVSYVQAPCDGSSTDGHVEVQITGSTGINYTAVVITQPEFERIEGSLRGTNRTGMVNAAGVVELADEQGNQAVLDLLAAPQVSASGTITWSSPSWIRATSDKGKIDNSGTAVIPSDMMTVTIMPSALPTTTTSASATMILVTDERTGAAPDNLRFIPITYICAASQVSLPLVYPDAGIVVR